MTSSTDKLPVAVITGALGSGKTTLINRILQGSHGLRIALLVNDFGEINIDRDLIQNADDDRIMELTNGCICCAFEGDLLRAMEELLDTRAQTMDYLLIETSGIADPVPVAQTLLVPVLESRVRLDAVIALADALNLEDNLRCQQNAAAQLQAADIILLNKIDLVSPEAVEACRATIRSLNPDIPVLPCRQADVDLDLLLDTHSFDGRRIARPLSGSPAAAPLPGGAREENRPPAPHHHGDALTSVSFRSHLPFDTRRLNAFLEQLPPGVIRAKGILVVRGLTRRVIFHKVGRAITLDQGEPWREGELPETKMVFIGFDFDKEVLLQQLRACLTEKALDR